MFFTTQTGSRYEVDGDRIRRLSGEHDPTPRQGRDGEWKQAISISEPTIGEAVLIVWEIADEDTARATVTSLVVGVER